jgi:hypothetical protein
MTTERLTFPRVVASEWTKFVSLRSTWLTLGGISVFAVGIAGAVGHAVRAQVDDGHPPPTRAGALAEAFLAVDFYTLVVGILGVLIMTGEYPNTVRATLTAVPRRWPIVAAKAVVLVGLTAPVMGAVAVASLLVSQAFLGDAGVSLGDPGVPGIVLGAAASPVLMGLVGLGIGTLLRHSAGAIATLVALLFIVPVLLLGVLSENLEDRVLKYVPTVAGQAMYHSLGDGSGFETLSAGASAGVVCGWVALLLAGGVAVLVRRDA